MTTVCGVDVHVTAGATLGDLRAELARVTGRPELATAPLGVGGRVLGDDHPAGVRPWVPGAALAVGGGRPDPAALAAAAPWHVAVVAGPDAGRVAVPGRDGRVTVGRPGPGRAPDTAPGRTEGVGLLDLTDVAVSRRHLEVRGQAAPRARWRVRDLGSANGTSRGTTGRRRPARRRAIRLRPDEEVTCGRSTLVVRTGPLGPPGDRTPVTARHDRAGPPLTTWLVPALGSVALAVMMRSPVLLVLGLLGPVAVLAPRLVRSRSTVAVDRPTAALSPDPALLAVSGAALLSGPAAVTEDADALRPPDEVGPPGPPPWWDLARGGGLGLVGPLEDVRAVARTITGSLLLRPPEGGLHPCLLHASGAAAWRWWRWLVQDAGASTAADPAGAAAVLRATGPATPRLVVSEGSAQWRGALHRWWASRRSGDAALLLERRVEDLPAWCAWVLHVSDGRGRRLVGPSGEHTVDVPGAPSHWAEEHVRRVVGAGLLAGPGSRDPEGTLLPRQVSLTELDVPGDLTSTLEAWAGPDGGSLRVPLGLDARRSVVTVDLVADGPHVLVAGTTGAGKSELLQTVLLGLGMTRPPDRLALMLVDHKGGTSFGACSDLPHVVGQVTDLDPVAVRRALDGLRVELRRREVLLADAGVGDLDALRRTDATEVPPRLVVVLDEFAALVEDMPEAVPGLVRAAAQGRALGVHLVLATQRPAGAVSATMRANLAVRLCLRVADTADSLDVVDVPDAAHIPPDRPGRVVLRRGPGPVQELQTAWVALSGSAAPAPGARRATWPEAPGRPGGSPPSPAGADRDHARHLVGVAAAAAAAAGVPRPAAPWLPDLPVDLPQEVLDDLDTAGALEHGLALGLLDVPEEQARRVLRWLPRRGTLVVAGRAGSGRTTTLRTVARAALAAGHQVHVVAAPGDAGVWHPLTDALGTVVDPSDPRRLARLLDVLVHDPAPAGAPPVLVLDDVAAATRALEDVPRGAGTELLHRAVRGGRHLGVAVAGAPGDVLRLGSHASDRVVLAVTDAHDDTLLGVPRGLAGARRTAGRGVHLGPEGAASCQVARPGTRPLPGPAADPGPRLMPLPRQVSAADVPALPGLPGAAEVPVGLGGDTAEPVGVDVGDGLLVVGPPGSGRTTALAVLALALRARGWEVLEVRGGESQALRHTLTRRVAPDGAVDTASHEAPPPPRALVVDDLDTALRADPAAEGLLDPWTGRARPGRPTRALLAAVRTDAAATAYRGPLAALRQGPVLVLRCGAAGSSEAAGADLAHAVDPAEPLLPGRGALVERGRVTPLQVASVTAGSCSPPQAVS